MCGSALNLLLSELQTKLNREKGVLQLVIEHNVKKGLPYCVTQNVRMLIKKAHCFELFAYALKACSGVISRYMKLDMSHELKQYAVLR